QILRPGRRAFQITDNAPQAGLFRSDPYVCRLDLGGAELELGDLAHRVELWVGQQVCGRLGKAERNEHHALRHIAVGAGLQHDLATSGRDTDETAGWNAQPVHLARVEPGDGLRLERVEIGGTTRHGARVPVLEEASGR